MKSKDICECGHVRKEHNLFTKKCKYQTKTHECLCQKFANTKENNHSQQPKVIACQGEGENSSMIASDKSGSELSGTNSDKPSADALTKDGGKK